MGYPKLTPITATGATEPRYLGDRFADIVNVKDFGAKGDGVTDDTAAFEAAISTEKPVFVPDGNYNVATSFQYDKLYCIGENVHFYNFSIDIQNIQKQSSYFTLNNRRRAVALLDRPAFFVDNGDYSSVAPQSFEITDNYIFVGITAGETDTTNAKSCVSVYGKNGEYKKTYICGYLSSNYKANQFLTVFERYSYFEVYTVAASDVSDSRNKICKFIIDKDTLDSTSDGIETTASTTYSNIPIRYNGFVIDDVGIVADESYYIFSIYNFNQNLIGYLRINFETSAEGYTTKVQSITGDGSLIAGGCGAWYYYGTTPLNASQNYGVKVFSSNGVKIASSLFDAEKIRSKYNEKFGVDDIKCIENEGVSIHKGRIYTLSRLKGNDKLHSVFGVFEEFSSSPDAMDCSDCKASDMFPASEELLFFDIPILLGSRYNPYTGEAVSGIVDLMNGMKATKGWKRSKVNTSTVSFLDSNGSAFPNNITLEITKLNDNTFLCVSFGDVLSILSSKIYTFTNNSWTASERPLRKGDLHLAESVSYGMRGRLMGVDATDGTEFTALRVLHDISVSTPVKKTQVGDSGIGIVDLLAGTGKASLSSNYFYPGSDNAISLGSGSARWKTVYAATGSINTSDERLKSDISDLGEALMRAWGNVRFKVFKFKNAIAEKGKDARKHVGIIAQDIERAFEAEGIDARQYGLFCFDEWEDVYDFNEVDADGESRMEKTLAIPAGNRFGVRYEEALALECAYQRWRLEQLEERVNQLINSTNN